MPQLNIYVKITRKTVNMSEKTFKFPAGKIAWPALAGTKYGDLEALEVNVPATITARIDIWAIPKCEAYPEGYFVSVNTGNWYEAAEPSCESDQKHLLLKVKFTGVPAEVMTESQIEDTSSSGDRTRTAVVEYLNPFFAQYGVEFNQEDLVPEKVEVE
jgi:hypothetical protein